MKSWLNSTSGLAASWLVLLLGIGLFIHAFLFSNVNADAGYYLSIARDLNRGYTLYSELKCNYSPLVFYIVAFLGAYKSYYYSLLLVYVSYALGAWLVYKILALFNVLKGLRIFAAGAYLLLCYRFEGSYFLLEGFVNVFVLLALYSILKSKPHQVGYVIAAALASTAAFATKQYGLMVLGIVVVNLWMARGLFNHWLAKAKTTFIYLLAFAVIAISALTVYLWVNQLAVETFLVSISGGGYGTRKINIRDFAYVERMFLLKSGVIVLLLSGIWLRKIISNDQRDFLLACFFSLIITVLPSVIRQYAHYYIFQAPFIVFIVVLISDAFIASKSPKWLMSLPIIGVLLFANYILLDNIFLGVLHHQKWNRAEQYASARVLATEIGTKPVVIVKGYEYFYLAKLNPINRSQYGYTFLDNLPAEALRRIVCNATYLLTLPEKPLEYSCLEADCQLLPDKKYVLCNGL